MGWKEKEKSREKRRGRHRCDETGEEVLKWNRACDSQCVLLNPSYVPFGLLALSRCFKLTHQALHNLVAFRLRACLQVIFSATVVAHRFRRDCNA